MNGYLAIVILVAANGVVQMPPPVHFDDHALCQRYARDRAWEEREGVALRYHRCLPGRNIRLGGDALLEEMQ